ncbi:hypothetical protein B0H14DRAFT_2416974 [Mycena olivaceomarginata]|nr:hypothetical protein B0H14DRAFT_2416974 [Mycena olivaceomarginata]
MFEIYWQVHRVCPRFSLEGSSKVICYLQKSPRRPYLAEQLSTAYDTYLVILCATDHCVQEALGQNENWKAKNVCPPCFYKLACEPPLLLSWLGCMDRNNSLKLVDSMFRPRHPRFDNRKTDSFRWLTAAEVNAFKDEVANSEKVNFIV